MRRHRMPDVKEGNVNVTPLIDIVMCLIIFFMLVAKIGIDTGADQAIVIPTSFQGLAIQDMGNTLTLNVRAVAGSDQPMVSALVGGVVEELKLVDPSPATNRCSRRSRIFASAKTSNRAAPTKTPTTRSSKSSSAAMNRWDISFWSRC